FLFACCVNSVESYNAGLRFQEHSLTLKLLEQERDTGVPSATATTSPAIQSHAHSWPISAERVGHDVADHRHHRAALELGANCRAGHWRRRRSNGHHSATESSAK